VSHSPDADLKRLEQRLEQRIVELEVKAAFQERTLDDLDVVLRRLTDKVEAMGRELARVRGEAEQSEPPSTEEILAQVDEELE
jgi:uncharacterized coiled-coil protein SlyX